MDIFKAIAFAIVSGGFGLVGQGVELEGDRGGQADAQGPADLGTDEPGGELQDRGAVAAVLVGAVDGVEDGGLLEVAGDADVGYSDRKSVV